MKVFRIPPEQLERWFQWLDRQKKWVTGFDVIERLTGIRPKFLSEGGDFSFVPLPGANIPVWFSKPDAEGRIRPRRNFIMGRRLLQDWDKEEIPPIHVFFFWEHMGIEPTGPGRFQADEIGGKLYVINAEGWNPEDYGYIPLEL